MYPPEFDYVRANSVQEVVSLLQEREDPKLLAGGHSLIPLLKLRTTGAATLIDIGRVDELKGVQRFNGTVRVGPLSTHNEIAALDELPSALTEAAANIGDRQVRNRGTVGGNIAHADPASDLPTVMTALGAAFRCTGPRGERTITAGDFFGGWFATALGEHEVLTGLFIPARHPDTGTAYAKMPHPASGYAILGAAAALTVVSGRCTSAGVAVGGLTPKAMRAPSVEAALVGRALDADAFAKASKAVLDDLGDDLIGDSFASAEYRKAVLPVYVERALTNALARVGM
jgi:carbon-monoxide dehydrogenase medium subunit